MTKAEWLQHYLVKNGLSNARASFLTSVYAKLLNLKTETSRCPAQITDSTPTPAPQLERPTFFKHAQGQPHCMACYFYKIANQALKLSYISTLPDTGHPWNAASSVCSISAARHLSRRGVK